MNLDRIKQIESRVLAASNLSEQEKADLLADLAALRVEAEPLAAGTSAAAQPVEIAPYEGPLEPVVNELTASVEGLEASHPRLTQLVNRVAVVLSNMGI
jgi:hypothetical protein